VAAAVATAIALIATPALAQAATITVDSTVGDATANGDCELAEAITAANNNAAVDGCAAGTVLPDTISFDDPAMSGATVIQPTGGFPTITSLVTIDGTTDPDYVGPDPVVEIDGTSAGVATAFLLSGGIGAAGSVVEGLVINNFGNAIELVNAFGVEIRGNFLGLEPDGMTAAPNVKAMQINGGSGAVIGGPSAADRNLIAGNSQEGIRVTGGAPESLSIANNYIGIAKDGSTARSNGAAAHAGIWITGSAPNLEITDNVISGNLGHGVQLQTGITAAPAMTIAGNRIGTNAAGDAAVGNGLDGIRVTNANTLTIGGTTPAQRNVISGNGEDGIHLAANASNTTILGNYIGLDDVGTGVLGNGMNGVEALATPAAAGILIGGDSAGDQNVISGNTLSGVRLVGAGGVTTSGNLIGTDAAGSAAAGNSTGVFLFGATSGVTVGGSSAGERNVISGNVQGISTSSGTQNGNTILGNYIGLDDAGTAAIPNTTDGVVVNTAGDLIVGGTGPGEGNVISGNGDDGVQLSALGSGTTVTGNLIGTDATGIAPLGNAQNGIELLSGGHTIGGSAAAGGNAIGANSKGIDVLGAAASNNTIANNAVGFGSDRTTALGNTTIGIHVRQAATDTEVADNLVGNSGIQGISVSDTGTTGNVLEANTIGLDANGEPAANMFAGVLVDAGATGNRIGSTVPGRGNTITGGTTGVQVNASDTDDNAILGNSIYGNTNLGVDLADSTFTVGVTTNDADDADTHANEGQNFPVLTDAVAAGGAPVVEGTLHSEASKSYRVELFANDTADPTNHGEGETFLGTVEVTTDGSGNATFEFDNPSASLSGGQFVSATATELTGPGGDPLSSSEFSEVLAAASDTDADGVLDGADNCSSVANAAQTDTDGDGAGNACDSTPTGDADGDGVDNAADNCRDDANAAQTDTDGDGAGDACDSTPTGDADGDGVDNAADNCPNDANAGQTDGDGDGVGDACDGDEGGEPEPTATCRGEEATVVGTEGDDTLVGTDGDDVIVGLGGADSVVAGAGDDLICAGGGGDIVRGGGGSDVILGQGGGDKLVGQGGRDRLLGGGASDRLLGGGGGDRLKGQGGSDVIKGGAGADRLAGNAGKDRLAGGGGAGDRLKGGGGRDRLNGGSGKRDLCNGQGGRDVEKTKGCERVRRIP
jgi:hypothetical protein